MEVEKLNQLGDNTCFVRLTSETGKSYFKVMDLEEAFAEKAKHAEGMTQIVNVQIWHRLA